MLRTAWIGVLAFLADRISKQAAAEWLTPGAPKTILSGVLDFTYAQNTGMAFSILADRTWMLIVVSAVALAVLVGAFRRALRCTPAQRVMLWLLLAGGIGNLVDRLFYGYVVDFLCVRFVSFPVFNLADIYLTVSSFFLVIALLRTADVKQINGQNTSETAAP
jgi:signal peptidase II